MKKHLVLIGFMGTGKTSIGRQVANALLIPWRDTDQLLEQKWGCPVKVFFEEQGESAFRDEETKILQQTLQRITPTLITTGGGIVLRPENETMMKQKGWVIALRAHPQEVIRRLQQDQRRPLLQGGNITEKVEQLFTQRAGKYNFADRIIDTTHRSTQGVVKQICKFWNQRSV
jgi:shikimate kinase